MNIPKAVLKHNVEDKNWVKGINSKLEFVVNIPSGDWSQYLPDYEPQKFKFDTNECTQLSGINNIETQFNFLKSQGKFSEEAINWFIENGYFDENGLFDFSERFTAIMAGTTIKGNHEWSFWESIYNFGILPWKDLNYTLAESLKFNSQEEMCIDYYNPSVITLSMRQKALKALKWINIAFEYVICYGDVRGLIQNEIKQAPIQIGVPVCSSDVWNTGEASGCFLKRSDHAIICYKVEDNGIKRIRDHYNPKNKTLSSTYEVFNAIKGVITVVPQSVLDIKYRWDSNLWVGSKGIDVEFLQKSLTSLGYITNVTGVYDKETVKTVFSFQKERVITDVWSFISVWSGLGQCVGKLTRKKLNSIFN